MNKEDMKQEVVDLINIGLERPEVEVAGPADQSRLDVQARA